MDYKKELQAFRPSDEMNNLVKVNDIDYHFLPTASHGYLIVPKGDKNYSIAKKIVDCGYIGKLAIYLEEDSEAGQFLKEIKA